MLNKRMPCRQCELELELLEKESGFPSDYVDIYRRYHGLSDARLCTYEDLAAEYGYTPGMVEAAELSLDGWLDSNSPYRRRLWCADVDSHRETWRLAMPNPL